MLSLYCNEMVPSISGLVRDSLECKVVRFTGPTRKYDCPRRGADQGRHGRSCFRYCIPGDPSEAMMPACRIAVVFFEERQHCFDHSRIYPGSRVTVHINGRGHNQAPYGVGAHPEAGRMMLVAVEGRAVRNLWLVRYAPRERNGDQR